MRTLQVEPLGGYEPEIGRGLWALDEMRRRTLRLVDRLDQPTLDWEGPDGHENAIGTLLYHVAIAEVEWLHLDMPLAEWRRPPLPVDNQDHEVTPEWAIFHLVEHEAGHAFQISALQARAGRFFAAERR